MTADEMLEEWNKYFDNVEAMIFSGSRHFANPRTVAELEHVANQCIRQSHQRLLDSAELVSQVCRELSTTALMPWGSRLDVQGRVEASSCKELEPGKVSELLRLLRGPLTPGQDMRDRWIGIVRHDETPYMTGRLPWLVNHIAGRGRIRHLLFARDRGLGASSEVVAGADLLRDEGNVEQFCSPGASFDNAGADPIRDEVTVEKFRSPGACSDIVGMDLIWDEDRVAKFNQLIGGSQR